MPGDPDDYDPAKWQRREDRKLTKAQAVRIGFTHLTVKCPDCAWTATKAIEELNSIGTDQNVHQIARRMKCTRCGARAQVELMDWWRERDEMDEELDRV